MCLVRSVHANPSCGREVKGEPARAATRANRNPRALSSYWEGEASERRADGRRFGRSTFVRPGDTDANECSSQPSPRRQSGLLAKPFALAADQYHITAAVDAP